MNRGYGRRFRHRGGRHQGPRNLTDAPVGGSFIIKDLNTPDRSMRDFLFTLGCFRGERVTLISALPGNYIINVKDARYSIDADLARAILI